MTDSTDPKRPGLPLTLLQLVRFPTVFTCMADIFLGFLLTHRSFFPLEHFFTLLGASVCHYWTGMIMNDVFDSDVDLQERPARPIPSGRISRANAAILAVGLNAIGLVLAGTVGTNSLLIAMLLTVAIWSYDGLFKKTVLAPVIMGSCRFFNVMLGASAAASPVAALWCAPQVIVASGLGVYICGVTWFARQEAKESSRNQLFAAAAVIMIGLGILAAFILEAPPATERISSLCALGGITFIIFRRVSRAITDPVPENVQLAIKLLLMSLVMLDATVVLFATEDVAAGMATAALIVPTILLARRIPMT